MNGGQEDRISRVSSRYGAWIVSHLIVLLWPRGRLDLKFRVVGAIALIAVGKLINVGAPLIYKEIIDPLSESSDVVVPLTLIVAYGLAYAGPQIVESLRKLLFIKVAQRAVRLTALELFRHLHALSLRFHLERQTGGLSSVIHRGLVGIEYLLELMLFNIVPTVIELLLVFLILWRLYNVEIALSVLVTIILYASFSVGITGWQVRLRRKMNAYDVAASTMAVDSVLNYETIKYFGAENLESERYGRARRDYEKAAISNEWAASAFTVGQAAIIAIGLIVVMALASRGVTQGTMTVGDFVLVVAYLLQLYAPLGMLGTTYSSVKQSLADVEAMAGLFAQSADINDRPGAPVLVVPRGHIIFKDVDFRYDTRRPIIEKLSFEILPGKTVAIVGPSGSGKSTVARLLFRFYDVSDGAITIDDQDIRDVTQSSLRQAIGVVPQDTVLFNDTIYYNIAFGREGASYEEVEEAARLARIHDLVMKMPDGYQSRVGERGLKLSGGEKQRIAIARVILKRPSILIFDEATSALDSHTERAIQTSLRAVSAERSTLVIAHRLSTVVEADEILVLDRGRIVERGRHAELLAEDGVYATMWSQQLRAAEFGSEFAGLER